MGGNVEKLLVALEDERVKALIRKIVKVKETDTNPEDINVVLKEKQEEILLQKQKLEEENEHLRRMLEEQEAKHRKEMQMLASEAKQEIEGLRKELMWTKESEEKQLLRTEEMHRQMQTYENSYRELESIYRMYNSLNEELHRGLERVLCADSAELFLAWGIQWENLEALWDFLSYCVRDLEEEERNSLCKVFDYLFEVYQKVNLCYERLNTQVGDEFDEDIHTRGYNSAVGGRITKVLLQGYRGIRKDKIKKSIVLI